MSCVSQRYFVAIYRPDNYDPSVSEDDTIPREIDALNDEMVAAGVRKFVGGLRPAGNTKSISVDADGEAEVSEGTYLQAAEQIGGFWVLEVANEEEALAWGRKASVACRAPVEVRPFN